jgi:tetratricopeptide (TPR) repeat protein
MMKRLNIFGIAPLLMGLILILTLAHPAFADESQVLVAKANTAYAAGMYANAADLYKKVAESGLESVDLYYNLGNAYFKLNDYPNAILWYERAKRLDPGNESVNFNLNVTNNKITDKIDIVPEMFYKRWYLGVLDMFSSDSWAWFTILAFFLTAASAALYIISRTILMKKLAFWTGSVMLVITVIIGQWSLVSFLQFKNQHEAIIFTPTVTVKSSPDPKSVDLFVLHEGTKVSLTDQIGTWYEIRIANGSVGWLPAENLEKI